MPMPVGLFPWLVAAQLDGVGLGSNMTNEIDQMMRNIGVAVGLAALLKGTAYHAQRCVP